MKRFLCFFLLFAAPIGAQTHFTTVPYNGHDSYGYGSTSFGATTQVFLPDTFHADKCEFPVGKDVCYFPDPYLAAQTPAASTPTVAQTAANSSPSVVITPKAAGDSLLVECDYASATVSGAITDSASTAFAAIGAVNSSGSFSQFVALSAPLASAAADTVSCPNTSGFAEIYLVEIAGAVAADGIIQTNGSASPASGAIAANAGDLLVAFCITGTCTNAKGWTSLSAFDRNLVADVAATAPNTSASFKTSGEWILTIVALKPAAAPPPPPPPAPYVFVVPNCGAPGSTCTFTFPIASAPSLPACATADAGCYLSIQLCDTSGTPPFCINLSSSAVVNIVVNSPTAGAATAPLVTATSP